MAKDVFRIPVYKKFLPKQDCSVYQIRLTLELRTRTGAFVGMPFRFDTGSDFTTISMADADRLGIPYSKTRPMFPTGVAGKTLRASYLSVIRFSFLELPQVQFESLCSFSPYPLKRSLLSLTDIVPNFIIRSDRAGPGFPHGSVVFRLRRDHRGRPRP